LRVADPLDLSLAALGAAPLSADAPKHARRLDEAVRRAASALLRLDDAVTSHRPAPGKWSPREIIGHLIDSASNNHQRFVRVRARADLVVEGYEQDAWVSVQRYQESPWPELVALWLTYNRHLARVMTATPEEDRARSRAVHNLDRRAFRPVPTDHAVTLDYFMTDYVDHLEHHLAQVLG
jgi:hypothetical protein